MNASHQLLTDQLEIWTAAETVKKSGRGRSNSNGVSVYGIKKLRELILELAVRGKLVPQDPDDEPASELLKRIQADKTKLIAEGKIKKGKPLPPVTEDEKPFELPEGWKLVRLGNVLNRISNGYSGGQSKNYSNFPLTRIETISKAVIDFDKVGYCSDISDTDVEKFSLIKGDILLSHINSDFHLGKTAVYEGNATLIHGINLLLLRPNSLISYWYLHHVLTCIRFAGYFFTIAQHAIGQSSINQTKIREVLLALPPLAEQHRIVSKVDELMALCDQLETQHINAAEAHEKLVSHLLGTLTQAQSADDFSANWQRIAAHFDTLFTTESSIDALKQTVLQLAVMGKLVPQDPNDEPASELLKRIQAEKAKLIAEGKIKKGKPLPPITEEEKPFELPKGWEWIYVWNIAQLITSGSRDWAKYYSNSGAIFVTMSNLSRGNYCLRMDTIRYVDPPTDGEGSRTKLEEDDLLISITGDVGNLGLVPPNFGDAYINQHTCLLRFMSSCRNRYFSELMRSPLAKFQFEAPQRGIKNSFRLGDVGEMIIPLPPIPEQHRIVTKVDELMTLCDQLKTRITQTNQLQQQLADGIVEQAVSQ